jgi:hypothetical protein
VFAILAASGLPADFDWGKLVVVGLVVLFSAAKGISDWLRKRLDAAKQNAKAEAVDYEIVMGPDGEPSLRPVKMSKPVKEQTAPRSTQPTAVPQSQTDAHGNQQAPMRRGPSRAMPPVAQPMQQPRPRPQAPARPRPAQPAKAAPQAKPVHRPQDANEALYREYSDKPLSELTAMAEPDPAALDQARDILAGPRAVERMVLSRSAVRRGIILAEILGPPIALRPGPIQ